MDFISVLKEKQNLVWPVIEKYLSIPLAKEYKGIVKFHSDLISEYPKRKGKYVRPSLVVLTAEAMGVPTSKSLRVAAAMQVCEDWVLIHDDFEDDSELRRGSLTLHRLFSSELAINAGDFLHVLMWQMIMDCRKELGDELMFKVFSEFQKILRRTVLGQTAEIKWTQDRKLLTDNDWFFVADGKTSYYTIAGPMRLGAIIAGATEKQLDLIMTFGQLLGRAFQIRDDLLDLETDIIEGKRTLMLGHLLRTASMKDKKQIDSEMMEKYGSLVYAKNIADELAEKAQEFFDSKLRFLKKEPARSQLRAGIRFMVEREY